MRANQTRRNFGQHEEDESELSDLNIQYIIHAGSLPLYISILLEVIKSFQEILVDIPIQNIISHHNLQLLDAPPQPLRDPGWVAFQAIPKEQRDGLEWEPCHFPHLRDAEKWSQNPRSHKESTRVWADDEGVYR